MKIALLKLLIKLYFVIFAFLSGKSFRVQRLKIICTLYFGDSLAVVISYGNCFEISKCVGPLKR